MTLSDLIKPDPSLDADGGIDIYEIDGGLLVAHYQGLEIHERLLQSAIWEKERKILLEMTKMMDKHPEGYEGPCLCQLCRSCA